MNPEIKSKWLEALRSGKYTQGTKTLKSGPPEEQARYCCLGVLCDLHSKETNQQWLGNHGLWYYKEYRDYLPVEVVNWAGLIAQDPHVSINGIEYKTLSSVNDNGSTFKDIADLIEAQL